MPSPLDEIDAAWILRNIIAENEAGLRGSQTSITIHLKVKAETSTGLVTVERDLLITPQEVLAILAARPAAS
jgi:hypothetical protein